MGSNLSLNTKYKITIHPEIWIQKSNNVKKTKKNNGNNTLEISNADKTKYITRLIKSSKFKSILKYKSRLIINNRFYKFDEYLINICKINDT